MDSKVKTGIGLLIVPFAAIGFASNGFTGLLWGIGIAFVIACFVIGIILLMNAYEDS